MSHCPIGARKRFKQTEETMAPFGRLQQEVQESQANLSYILRPLRKPVVNNPSYHVTSCSMLPAVAGNCDSATLIPLLVSCSAEDGTRGLAHSKQVSAPVHVPRSYLVYNYHSPWFWDGGS